MQPLRTFLDAAEGALEGIAVYSNVSVQALQERVEWVTAAAESQGPAAGCPLLARAAVPPLVRRLRLTGDDETGARLLALATTPPPLGSPLPRFQFATPGGLS